MARIGPNQDINDFGTHLSIGDETIMETANWFETVDNNHSLFVAQSAAQNIFATGPSLTSVSIPLKMFDGSTELLLGDVDFKGPFAVPSDRLKELVPKATMVTYVNLPERFREYWEILNAVINSMHDYVVVDEEAGTITSQFFLKQPGTPKSTPEWIGEGPANYDSRTWPQLIAEIRSILVSSFITVEDIP